MARFSSPLKAKTSFVIKKLSRSESRSLGYAHWPEPVEKQGFSEEQSRSLGYAHWPELQHAAELGVDSLDHWDMRTGRNGENTAPSYSQSLDHWDMRTGRNS